MKYSAYILSAAFVTLSAGITANACEFHGSFGSKWSNYNSSQSPMDNSSAFSDDSSYQPAAVKTKKKKPVFSKVATRASDIAKARIERKETEAAKTEKIVEQASR